MPRLTMQAGERPGEVYPLERDETIIGRHADCHVVLPDRQVSGAHARIFRRADGLYIENLPNANADETRVNGRALVAARRLEDGDIIKICKYVLAYADPAVSDPSANETRILETVDASLGGTRHFGKIGAEEKLSAILEITADLAGVLELETVLEKVLTSLLRIFPQAERGFIHSSEEGSGELVPWAMKLRDGTDERSRPSRTVHDLVIRRGEAVLLEDTRSDSRFLATGSIRTAQVQSVMCAPLWGLDGQAVGVIQVDTRDARSPFKQADLDFLAAVAGTIGMAVENARLHNAALLLKKTEQEAKDARAVQQSFLPAGSPQIAGYRFQHHYRPALFVGGDYFDYQPYRHSRSRGGSGARDALAIALGDVAGKGMPAALLMARVATEVRLLLQAETDPARIVDRLNRNLCENEADGRFVTFLLAVLDPQRHRLTVVNAGHMGPILRRASGQVEVFGEDQPGTPLGIIADQGYRATATDLGPGDLVLLYTDGVNEALSLTGEPFGTDRLTKCLHPDAHPPPPSPEEAARTVLEAIEAHAHGREQSDDITLICFGRTPPPAREAGNLVGDRPDRGGNPPS